MFSKASTPPPPPSASSVGPQALPAPLLRVAGRAGRGVAACASLSNSSLLPVVLSVRHKLYRITLVPSVPRPRPQQSPWVLGAVSRARGPPAPSAPQASLTLYPGLLWSSPWGAGPGATGGGVVLVSISCPWGGRPRPPGTAQGSECEVVTPQVACTPICLTHGRWGSRSIAEQNLWTPQKGELELGVPGQLGPPREPGTLQRGRGTNAAALLVSG